MSSSRLIVILVVLSVCSVANGVTHVDGKLCTNVACMELVKNDEYTEVNYSRRIKTPMVCFARWENFRYVFELNGGEKTLYLRDGFHFSGISWRCDLKKTCKNWMKDAGVC